MPLGRQGHNVVYKKMGKPKYASDKQKGTHKMKGGKTMSDKEMKAMMKTKGRKMKNK